MGIKTALGMVLLLVLLGCSKLTLENYNKIMVGMSYDEVTGIIGNPDNCNDVLGIRSCTWGDKKRSINVSFAGGKVLLYASSNLK